MNPPFRQFSDDVGSVPLNPALPVARMLKGIVKRRRSIVAITIAAALIGTAAGIMKPPIYSATAVVQVGLAEREMPAPSEQGTGQVQLPVELLDREIQEARLLQSESLAHQVVLRLGLGQDAKPSRVRSALAYVNSLIPNRSVVLDRTDMAMRGLLSNLVVRNEPRSNLVSVTYFEETPEEAARIVNALIAEHVHSRRTQRLAARVATAKAAVSDLAITFGDRHYAMGRAKDALAQAEVALDAQQNALPPTEAELAATGFIVPARPETTPAGLPLSSIIGLAVVGGFVIALAFALIREFYHAETT